MAGTNVSSEMQANLFELQQEVIIPLRGSESCDEVIERLSKFYSDLSNLMANDKIRKYVVYRNREIREMNFKLIVTFVCNTLEKAATDLETQLLKCEKYTSEELRDTERKVSSIVSVIVHFINKHHQNLKSNIGHKVNTTKDIIWKQLQLVKSEAFKREFDAKTAVAINPDDVCPVCRDDLNEKKPCVFDNCRHIFCLECNISILEAQNKW